MSQPHKVTDKHVNSVLILDGEDGIVACRLHGDTIGATLPRISEHGRLECASRTILRMNNLILFILYDEEFSPRKNWMIFRLKSTSWCVAELLNRCAPVYGIIAVGVCMNPAVVYGVVYFKYQHVFSLVLSGTYVPDGDSYGVILVVHDSREILDLVKRT